MPAIPSTVVVLLCAAGFPGAQSGGDLATPAGDVPRGIVAIVNGEVITYPQLEKEVRREIRLRQIEDEQRDDAARQLRPPLLEQLIVHRLLQQECDRFKIEPAEDVIERFLQRQVEALRGQRRSDVSNIEEYFRYMFHATGDDETEIRRQARQQVRRLMLLQERVYRQEFISPRQLRAYYEAHRDAFYTDTQYTIRTLTIPKTVDTPAILSAVKDELESGAPFDEIVKKYDIVSAHGNTAVWEVTDGELESYLDPLPEVIRQLQVGEVSPQLNFQTHIRFIRLEKKVPGKALAFDTEEAQKMIQRRISDERREKQFRRYRRELLEGAHIRKFLDP